MISKVTLFCEFEGIGTFFKKESDDERKHAIQILDFLNVRGYSVAINPAELAFAQNEQISFEKPIEIFTAYKNREEGNFTSLNVLAKNA
jgi:ferritin